MRFIDLFAGIGGFHYAIKDLAKDSKLVMASEIDKYAIKTYALNHKIDESKILNIREYTGEDIQSAKMLESLGDIDLVMGGFPCQTFSNAGKKMGFKDETRGTLFFDIATIIESKKPKYILLENVKHLASHDEGRTWITIRDTLRNLGYLVPEKPLLLSPHQFGIRQIRWRVFIPAILKNENLNQSDIEFSFEDEIQINNGQLRKFKQDKPEDLSDSVIITDPKILKALEAWGEFIKNVKRPVGRTLPVIWVDELNDKQADTKGMPDWKRKYIRDMKYVYQMNKEYIDEWKGRHNVTSWQKREKKLEWQVGADEYDYKKAFVQLRQSGFRFKKPDIFPTLVAMVQTSIIFDKRIDKWRYLSLDEVRDLQSFPKKFKSGGIPEYQTYKQFGNSVNVDVVKMVLKKLINL